MKSYRRWVLLGAMVFIAAVCMPPLTAVGADGNSGRSESAGDFQPGNEPRAESDGQSPAAMMKHADALVQNAEDRYYAEELTDLEIAAGLYERVASQQPDNFEANWKTAKACRLYGEEVRKRKIAHWEDTCAEYGKKGMFYANRAIELAPDRIEGYFYYALCVGTYSDGVGLFTALREGLRGEVQSNLEKAYSINKFYDQGGPIIALGRFWQLVPWPYNDEEKAMELYREIQQTRYFDASENVELRIYMAEILAGQWGEESKEEARRLLEEVPEMTKDPYWIQRAQTLLKQL